MAETLIQKAQRLGVKPQTETLLQKAQRLGVQPTPQVQEPGYFSRVSGEFSRIGKGITEQTQKGAEAIRQSGNGISPIRATGELLRTGLRTAGGIAEAAFAPIMEAPIIKPLAEKAIRRLVEIPGVNSFVTSAVEIAQKNPRIAKDIQNIVDIATLGGGKVLEAPLGKEARAIGRDLSKGIKVALTPSEEVVHKNIIELFNRSVKPSTKSLSQGERYENQVLNALRTIKAKSPQLNIEDEAGELVSRTPQTISELSQGLEQTKKLVFTEYDNLAKKAGQGGARIDAKPIANEVSKVAQDKSLQITNPEVIKYAEQWAERLQGLDVLDTETTQAVIQNLNNSLKAFYRNPTYESASKAAIDAGVANNFRQALDNAIQGATGEQYQVLKNQYSALKAIEEDVIKASSRLARLNTKGLLDYSDIFTSGQMVGGIMSLNPAMFTKGAVERGFKEFYKFLNDPNRAVYNIFERLNIDSGQKFFPESATGKFIANPKLGMSIEDVTKGQGDLIQEARKYKTAEEFVNNKINVFHATNEAQAKSIESVGFKPSLGRGFSNQPGDFAYFTPSVDGAIRYSKTSANGLNKITSGHLKGNILKIDGVMADFEAFGKAQEKLGVPLGIGPQGKPTMLDIEGLKRALKENGYSAIEFKDRYSNGARAIAAIPEDVVTKSQLTDIWNKANQANK